MKMRHARKRRSERWIAKLRDQKIIAGFLDKIALAIPFAAYMPVSVSKAYIRIGGGNG